MLTIRKTTEKDMDTLLSIYAKARLFMKENGNANQWASKNWPPEELLRQDISEGNSYVCLSDGRIVGTFYFISGKDIEPTYRTIYDGAWTDDSAYGVIHRIASDGTVRGIGQFCMEWAFGQCHHLRIDTHPDNTVMQNLLKKCGFVRCGTIYVTEDPYPRFAYEKVEPSHFPL